MTQSITRPLTLHEIADARWRVEITQEIESAGTVLSERQVAIYTRALAVLAAADGRAVMGTPTDSGDDGLPNPFGTGVGNGVTAQRMVTEKQLACLRREIPRRETSSPSVRLIADKLAAGGDPMVTISRKAASTALDILFHAPFLPQGEVAGPLAYEPTARAAQGITSAPARKSDPDVTEEGSYQVGPDVYRVRRSKSSGRLYAELLSTDTGKFAYDKGAIWRISADDRMSVEEAKAYGVHHGRCCVCARTLSAEKSVSAGIGPICASKV